MHNEKIEFFGLGQKLLLRTKGDTERAREAVELAERILEQVEKKARGAAPIQVALLALLEVCEKWIEAREGSEAYRGEIAARTQQIQLMLEKELK